ncbi:MAG: heavy metal translocating P-type ATPase [Candidatus Methylacidiphilales bacterium]
MSDSSDFPEHPITEHEGILGVEPQEGGSRVAITFDPQKLDDEEVRRIASAHIRPHVDGREPGLRRWVLRLDGRACEAAASRLEKRVAAVRGVRRATATYVGQVLCLTFDEKLSTADELMQGLRQAGAKVEELTTRRLQLSGWWPRLRAGDWNEELSCGIGLVSLVAAVISEHTLGRDAVATLALYASSYLFGGQEGVRSAWASLKERTLDVDLLMVLAALGAALVGQPFEGALLLFLFSFSNVLQSHALERTRRAIESLLTLRPEKALRKTASGSEEVSIDSLKIGDVVIVRPGELMPSDGVVTEGSSFMDEASLTGESMPVEKVVGAGVFAGTMNQSGALEVRVTRAAEDATLARMVRLVAEAQAEKSHTQRFLEKAEQRYAAGVIVFTALVCLVPWLVWETSFDAAFLRAMTVMVVASPCALIISTPATVLSAIGGAARRGVLIKGGAHLETAARIDTVCLDKTGTLTHGKPELTHLFSASGEWRRGQDAPAGELADLLRLAAGLESKSEHPLARSIVAAAGEMGLEVAEATSFQSLAGKGAEAKVDSAWWVAGSFDFFMAQRAEGMEVLAGRAEELEQEGRTCVWFGRRTGEGGLESRAVLALADTLRSDATSMIRSLHQMGIKKVVMLTGDRAHVAEVMAKESEVDAFYAGLLPDEKVTVIRKLKEEGTVLMVGDGVNDAPALATAHLGVAMGAAGTDVAMETADVVLMGDRLENIPLLLGMARHAKRVLVQNLVFASSVIAVLVLMALGFDLPLPVGVVGHEGSTVLVCLNGLRLLGYQTRGPV